jgi:hypothetical protein
MSFEGALQDLKVPQLRNMYEKVGMFGMADVPFNNSGDNAHKGDQIRGFGFTHDGAVDTLERFHNAALFDFSLSGADPDMLRKQMVQFMFAFDSNLKPVVGQQVTLTSTNAGVTGSRIDLLIARAAAGDTDLIVKYTQAGEKRGAQRLLGGDFETDKTAESTLTDGQLRNLALTAGQEVTYTAVPVGAGTRMGIDRDEDAILDADDNCPAFANPGQEDSNSDGVGDACEPPDIDGDGVANELDNCPVTANANQLDTDGDGAGDACDTDDDNDGLSDADELTIYFTDPLLSDSDGDNVLDGVEVTNGTNPNNTDTDGDGVTDDVDVEPLSFNVSGDVAPLGAPDGIVNVADLLIQTRFIMGLSTPGTIELQNGDLYPVGLPDGVINMSDLILIRQLVLP